MENGKPKHEVRQALWAMHKSVQSWRLWHGDIFMIVVAALLALVVLPLLGGTVLALEQVVGSLNNLPMTQMAILGIIVSGVLLGLGAVRVCVKAVEYAASLHNTKTKWGLDWAVGAMIVVHVAAISTGLTAKGVNFFGIESPDQMVMREVKERWAEVTGQVKPAVGVHPLVAFKYDELTRDKVSLQRAYAQVMNWGDALNEAAKAHQLPVALLAAVMHIESSGRPEVCSGAGACGLMGLMPVVAGDANVFDPQQNVLAGAKYLASLIRDKGDVVKALAFYNARHALIATAYVKASLAGADSLTALALTPEVQEYVINVLAYEQAFAELGTSRNGRPQSYGEKYGGDKSSTTHTVKSGDTCDGLAQENGITTGCLMEANDIADCQRDLKAGIKIKIPPRKDCV